VTESQFAAMVALHEKTEIEKARYLAFYHFRTSGLGEFTLRHVADWFASLHLTIPNLSRLRKRLSDSRSFIKGSSKNHYRLHARAIDALTRALPALGEQSETVVSPDTIIPTSLVTNTRGFVESLARQINAAYEYNIYDGCAVLMRRLIEVLLILTYQSKKILTVITTQDGSYKNLNSIIDDAVQNETINLTKDTKRCLHTFRKLGNLSAHKIHYNAKRSDLQKTILEFRASVEELLYAATLKS